MRQTTKDSIINSTAAFLDQIDAATAQLGQLDDVLADVFNDSVEASRREVNALRAILADDLAAARNTTDLTVEQIEERLTRGQHLLFDQLQMLRSSLQMLFSAKAAKAQMPEGMDPELVDFKISAPPADFGSERSSPPPGEGKRH